MAAACDQIVMPESGEVAIVGLRAEVTFFKNLFDWLHLKADMLRVGEYKSAAEPFSRTEMSKEFRHEMEEILDDYLRQIVDGISKSRKLDAAKVCAAIDNGPYTAGTRCKLGLIDKVAYEDEIEGMLKQSRTEARGRDHQELRQKEDRQRFQRLRRHDEDDEPAHGGRADETPQLETQDRRGARRRRDHVGQELDQFLRRRDARLRDVHQGRSPGGRGKDRQGDRAPRRQPRRIALASDLMWRALQKSGQAGDRQHGRRGGQRRILHLDGCQTGSSPSRER